MLPSSILAQDYSSLWNKYSEADRKDLSRDKIALLDEIIVKSTKERSYGNLLAAETKRLLGISEISPDSISPSLLQLEKREKQAASSDKTLDAVYCCVLADVYSTLSSLDDATVKAADYRKKALLNPGLLAKTSAFDYKPFLEEGSDSKIFNNDLLSVIGYRLKAYDTLGDFYTRAGNRNAALLASLAEIQQKYPLNRFGVNNIQNSKCIAALDSLINVYSDLSLCGEVAWQKYQFIAYSKDATRQTKALWLKEAQRRWPAYDKAERFADEYRRLTAPTFKMYIPDLVLPGKEDKIMASVINLKELKVAITRLDMKGDIKQNGLTEKRWKQLYAKMLPRTRIEVNTPVNIGNDYDEKTVSFSLPKLVPGIYIVEATGDADSFETKKSILVVTDVYVVKLALPKGKTKLVVLSATSGQPLPGAKIDVELGNGKHTVFAADKQGEVVVPDEIDRVRAYTDTDNYMQPCNLWGNFFYNDNNKNTELTMLFTDRSIYRPGQQVHVSAVAYSSDGHHRYNVAADRQLKIQLRDANRKVVGEKTAVTDEFGTAAADFTLPAAGKLNGMFSVSVEGCGSEMKYIHVEEYKRPTFEVTFDEYEGEYHNGDTVEVTGHAMTYAGVPVQGATVKYSVDRSLSRWPWFFYSHADNSPETMMEDTVKTGDDGSFRLRIPVVLPEENELDPDDDDDDDPEYGYYRRPSAYYDFTAKAQVVDAAGESHDAETSLRLGTKPVSLYIQMKDKLLASEPSKLKISRMNASGKETDGDVTYWFDADKANSRTVKANQEFTIDWKKTGLFSGAHELWAVCGEDTVSSKFTLFSLDDRRPVVDTPDWSYITATEFPRNGEPVQLQIGSSNPLTHIVYTMISGEKVIKSGSYDISNSLLNLKFPYREEYGECLLLNFLWVKDGKTYSHSYTITRPAEDKSLELTWKTFRDKLEPGQKEKWTLSVKRPDAVDVINKYPGQKDTGIQLLAYMYDKSLDQIMSNPFYYALYKNIRCPQTSWTGMETYTTTLSDCVKTEYGSYPEMQFSRFDFEPYLLQYRLWDSVDGGEVLAYGRPRRLSSVMKKESKASRIAEFDPLGNDDMAMAGPMAANFNLSLAEGVVVTSGAEDGAEDAKQNAAVPQLRENMQETAFFYPQLLVGSNGEVDIEFTLPESVTTWNFRGFAHDKYMNFGTVQSQTVASKKVMVMPNVPRFVRQGDKASVATRVVNNTSESMDAMVKLELVDPVSDKVVYTADKTVTLKPNDTESVAFAFEPDNSLTMLVCRMTAQGAGFSDGEQHYLPVLPSGERVMNTVPFTLTGKGEKKINVDELFPKGSSDRKLTVEYTANPTWLMIQALPYMAETNQQNAISLAAAYYANVLGRHIMTQAPVIKSVVNLWKQEAADSQNGKENSMMSALEKNQELKQLVLDETPWVMDADKETEQKQMLVTYFDEAQMDYRISRQLDGLKDLQNSNGSWSWWKGMDGSPSMTAEVLEMMARLNTMAGEQSETKSMVAKAMKYLGDFCLKEYEEMMKREKEGKPVYIWDSHAIQYLYINALLDRELPARELPMKDYLLSYLRKDRKRNIYAKALMAIILNHDGYSAEAKEYVESIRQFTVQKPGMGRYFDTPRAGYSWFDYRIPTQTAAIEAIKAVDPTDTQTVDEMRMWLLQSKRTQAWDTPLNSVNAVYAFLDGRYSELKSADGVNGVTLSADGNRIDSSVRPTAGLGYQKTTVDLSSAPKAIAVEKNTDGMSWGAVYAQFSQDAADVKSAAQGIKVERSIQVPKGKTTASLNVGDRITVRLTITADRDYDFVQVVDKRAACMEPVEQTTGYGWGYYCSPKDNATNYYFDRLSKGRHIVEKEYYIDRTGSYTTGTCTVQCAYSPEFGGRTGGLQLTVVE